MPSPSDPWLIQRKRGPKFYAKIRANGHQTTKLIGPAWEKRGRPPEGYFTHAMAEVELHRIMEDASSARPMSTVTFGVACREWLRYLEHEKLLAERTLGTNRSAVRGRLVRFFGEETQLTDISTARIDAFRAHSLTVGGECGHPLKPTLCSAT
jgi:hypothetical protein